MAGTALLTRLKLGSPIFFRQTRSALEGKDFTLRKFRSMSVETHLEGQVMSDAQRLESFGRWLRRSSLDELPQIIHVLKGEMSLVGPRPLPSIYAERYNVTQLRRLEVKPGLTGWAQVHGRDESGWEQRLANDVWYVDNLSLFLDLKIIFKTFSMVILRKGMSAKGHPTMTEFYPELDK